jgi:hypothetical protein
MNCGSWTRNAKFDEMNFARPESQFLSDTGRISCVSPDLCYVTGSSYATGPTVWWLFSYNGTDWVQENLPLPADDAGMEDGGPISVYAVSADDVWVGGARTVLRDGSPFGISTVLWHKTAGGWSVERIPDAPELSGHPNSLWSDGSVLLASILFNNVTANVEYDYHLYTRDAAETGCSQILGVSIFRSSLTPFGDEMQEICMPLARPTATEYSCITTVASGKTSPRPFRSRLRDCMASTGIRKENCVRLASRPTGTRYPFVRPTSNIG